MSNRRPPRKTLRGPETLEVRRLLTRVAWPVEAGGNGHEYEPVADFVTWEEARAVAAARGGHLVTITSEAENQFVFGLINAPEYWHPVVPVWGPWIGYYQADTALEPDGGWQWVTREPWVYHDWRDSEPNDYLGEHQAHYNADGFAPEGRAAAWNDQGPLAPLAFVIEYDEFADTRDYRQGDRLEPNDGFALATDLGVASQFPVNDLALADLVDRDWLRFRPQTSGYARIRVEAPAGSRDLIDGVFDSQRRFVPSSNEEGVNTRLLYLSTEETYYVSIHWVEARAGEHLAGPLPYRIVIETGLDLAAPDVPLSQAIPLTVGDRVVANADGFLRGNEARDLYAFDRGNRTHFDAAITAPNLEQAVFHLLDSAGQPVDLLATLANGRLRLAGELPPGDRFYLEVSHAGSGGDLFYDLEFALSRVLPTPSNTSPDTATALGPQQEFTIEAVQQANAFEGVYFTFTALATGPHWLSASTDGSGQVGIELRGLDDPAARAQADQIVELALQAGQRYQVRLTGSDPGMLTMRLRPATAAVPDRFEDNDSPQAPGLLEVVELAVYEGLTLHYDPQPFQGPDRDYYRIAAPETGLLVVSLEGLELAGAAELVLRRSDGLSAPSFYARDRTRAALPLAPGLEVTLEVVPRRSISIGYRLRLEVAALPPNEPSEAPLDWGVLGALPATHYALDYDGDVDRYRFTAAESGRAIVSFRRDDARPDISANLGFSSAAGRRTSYGRPRGDGWVDYPLTVLAGETIELALESAPGGYQLAVATGPDDPWEPDNTLGDADKTYSSSPSEHLLGPGDDVDLVTVFRTNGYAGSATLTFDQAELGLDLALVDRRGNVLAQGVVGTNQATVELPFAVVAATEPAFLRVTRLHGQGRYIATLTQRDLFAAATSFGTAVDRGVLTELPREVWNLGRNQPRYFKFTAGAGGVLQASITSAAFGAALELYGADQELLASARSGQPLVAPVVANQAYYLRLSVSASLAFAVQPPAENLSLETAVDLGRVQLVRLPPLPLLAGQAAWYRFTAAISGNARISTGGELYEQVEQQWRLLDPVFSNYQVREGASYALKLPAAQNRLVGPSIRLDLGDDLEPNDTPAAASYFGKLFATGGRASVLLGPNDVDHFGFFAGRAGLHRLTFDGAVPPGSSVQILEASGAVLATGQDSVQAVLDQGKVYLLRITGADVQQPTPYAFVLSWLGDRYEPNDSGATAADWGQFAFRREEGLSLHEPADVDWFSFVAPKAGQATLGVNHAGGALQFEVLDAGGAVVASAGPAAERLEVAWNAAAGARYRLHVFAAAATDVAEYSVELSLPTITADFDGNGLVDLSDFGLLKAAFGRLDASRAAGDADGDGDVDLSDFGLLKANLGRT
ncbi:MAG: hypothetical protein U0836_12355 [Pirellulales bacterium]